MSPRGRPVTGKTALRWLVITDPVGQDALTALVETARAAIREHGDGNLHTVAAAVLDEHDGMHVGLNLYHFTGGPCAELVALANTRRAGARDPRLIVAVGDNNRGVLAPCGRDRQVLADRERPQELVRRPWNSAVRSPSAGPIEGWTSRTGTRR